MEYLGFSGGSDDKESTSNAGDLGSLSGLGRSPGGGHGNPHQYPCLENLHWQRTESDMTEWLITAKWNIQKKQIMFFSFSAPIRPHRILNSVMGTRKKHWRSFLWTRKHGSDIYRITSSSHFINVFKLSPWVSSLRKRCPVLPGQCHGNDIQLGYWFLLVTTMHFSLSFG